jgi:hypothetical protein
MVLHGSTAPLERFRIGTGAPARNHDAASQEAAVNLRFGDFSGNPGADTDLKPYA